MRLIRLFSLVAVSASFASAQTAAPAKKPATASATHSAAKPASANAAKSAAGACVQVPELSSKIPSLPAGASCPKALYTITTTPAAHISYASPLEGAGIAEQLGLESSSFTLAYIDIQAGSGPLAPPHKYYSIHYTGYLTDGTKFDSSVDRGTPLTVLYGEHKVIPGWDTGFAGMHIGGKRRLFIPYQLAYGTGGSGPIPPKAELVFDVELVSVSDNPPPPPPTPAAPAAAPAATTEHFPTPAAAPANPAKP